MATSATPMPSARSCPTRDTPAWCFYVDLDNLDKVVSQVSAGDQEVADNLKPLQAFGFSVWTDGDVARTSLKISTD